MNTHNSMQARLLEVAKDLFWQKGFASTSIGNICEDAGCSRGNIYHHFENKETMLFRILLHEMETLVSMVQPLVANHDIPPTERLRLFILKHVEHTLSPSKARQLHSDIEWKHLSSEHRASIIELRDKYDTVLRGIITDGIHQGEFANTINVKVVNYALSSAIIRSRIWYSPSGVLSVPELAEALFKLFMHGLAPR